jgi:16S rRNA (guanine966-N2)-methyltransferase
MRRATEIRNVGVRPLTGRDLKSIIERLKPWTGFAILELFAGMARLTIEALEQGAASAVLVDNNKDVQRQLRKIIQHNPSCVLLPTDFRQAIRKLKSQNKKFDLIFIDPPFDSTYLASAIDAVVDGSLSTETGIILLKHAPSQTPVLTDFWTNLFTIKRNDIIISAWQYVCNQENE